MTCRRSHRSASVLGELASRNIFVGTSSWKYEGWLGQLYPQNATNTGARSPGPGLRRNAFPNTRTGVIMFEFSRFYSSDFERGRHFVAALDVFLGHLPKGWQFGVELRNPGFLKPDYFAMQRNHGVTHVFNAWTQMPTVNEQIALEGSFTADFFASRFLLRKGRAYQAAVEAFSPYSEVKDVNPEARDAMKSLAQRSSKRASFIFVNNRLEGNALKTITGALVNGDELS